MEINQNFIQLILCQNTLVEVLPVFTNVLLKENPILSKENENWEVWKLFNKLSSISSYGRRIENIFWRKMAKDFTLITRMRAVVVAVEKALY